MNKVEIKMIIKDGAKKPSYQTTGSAGADICAFLQNSITIKKGERVLIPTGLKIEVPFGYEAQVRSRSGLAIKNGIMCLNSPGTIDSDYRGEVKVILANFGEEDFVVNNGDRIAQLVISPVIIADFVSTSILSETNRDSGGFGSTGL